MAVPPSGDEIFKGVEQSLNKEPGCFFMHGQQKQHDLRQQLLNEQQQQHDWLRRRRNEQQKRFYLLLLKQNEQQRQNELGKQFGKQNEIGKQNEFVLPLYIYIFNKKKYF